MSASSWDLTVPEGDAELLAELRRHGVVTGQRLRVVALGQGSERVNAFPEQARFSFAGMITEGPADLATNADDYLAEGFGRS